MKFPDKYPELLQTLAHSISENLQKRGLCSQTEADEIGFDAAEEIRFTHGGQDLYITKGVLYELSLRDMEIFNQVKAGNISAVARQYDMTERNVYKVYNRVRRAEMKRRQTDFFDTAA